MDMARIPYADLESADLAPVVGRIVAERGRVLNLYAMLLNSPAIAQGWLAFLTAVRQQAKLPARIRELLIMRVAVLNGAEYEYRAHIPFALGAGLTRPQLDALQAGDFGLFDAKERCALAYCDEMTRSIRVRKPTFDALRPHFDQQELVEITATIGAYNCVSRFLEALEVDHER